jgi:outer membrane murein-binding lipoprotein Lpp
VERAQSDTSADIAALAIKIDGLAVQVQAMQVEAARREGAR